MYRQLENMIGWIVLLVKPSFTSAYCLPSPVLSTLQIVIHWIFIAILPEKYSKFNTIFNLYSANKEAEVQKD
jgi:hypothetical protein